MQTAHFVITLFNLALWDADKHHSPTRTAAWLDRRCDLFETFCLPSMMAQKGARALRAWLVFFDASTPEPVRRRVEDWRRLCPALTPLFFTADQVRGFTGTSMGRRVDFITSAIDSLLTTADRLVITTNLDNDDALASDALARIEDAAREGCVISLTRGWQYFTAISAVTAMTYPHNHFLSLCERTGSPLRTIESMSHRRARQHYQVIDLDGAPGWLEVVHDSNVSNELRITSRIRYRRLRGAVSLAPFGLDLSFTPAEQRRANRRLTLLFVRVALWRLRRKLFRRS